MLQRQVMFKQLQELQRRQQLQELGDPRNQNFINQLSSLKHAPVGQFSTTVNGGPPLLDSSQMFAFGNIEMMPSGLALTQNHNPDAVNHVGLSPPQFDMSSYGTHGPNDRKNFHQYSHLQGPSNLSVDLRTKSHNSLGVTPMQPMPFGSTFMNQQFNFPSDRIRTPDGQIPIEACNRESLSGNYSQQGILMQGNASLLESEGGNQDADWDGFSPGKSSNHGLLGTDASLDPLEQKILYGDDSVWESSFGGNNKMSTAGFQTTVEHASQIDSLSSIQSGSWSALMQSAVAETSSSDTVMQEEWSGLSFKNPESLNGNQLPNFIEGKKLQTNTNWVDRNLQNVPPSSSWPKHMFQNLNMNHSFPSFQESGHQYGSLQTTLDPFPGNTRQLIDHSSQQKLPTQGMQPIQTPLLSNVSPDAGFRLPSTDPQAYSFFPTLGNSSTAYLSGSSTNDTENTHPALPIPRPTGVEFLGSTAAIPHNSDIQIIQSGGQEFPVLEKNPVAQPSLKSDMLQQVGLPTPWPADIATQQNSSAHKPSKFSNLLGFPNPASSSLEVTEHPNQKSFQREQELSSYTRKIEGYDQQLKQANSLPKSSSEMNNSIPLGSMSTREYEKNHHLEAGATGSDSLTTSRPQQLSNQVEGGDNEAPSVPPGDIEAFHNSSSQKFSLVHQRSNANAMEPVMSRHQSGVKDIAKCDSHVVLQPGISGDIVGLNFSQENQVDESSKDSSTTQHQKQGMLGQSETPVCSIAGIEACNLTYPSQISLQMVPSWIKNYGTLKHGNLLPISEPKSAVSAEQQFPDLRQNTSTMQVNLAQANQGDVLYPSTAPTSILSKQLDGPSMVASDVTSQKLAVAALKKRKLAEFSMVPWCKEMNHEPSRLLHISIAELVWAQALNRRAVEVKDEVDVAEEFPAPVQAKRRLICTTQLMQQVFGPVPSTILHSDASSNCDFAPFSAARLTLGDACNLTGLFLKDANDIFVDKPKASKRRKVGELAKLAEGFITQTRKLTDDLQSIPRKLWYAALRVEAQELEKFSIINRFANIHIKAHSSTFDPGSSSAMPKSSIRRYVVAVPMPSSVPEGVDCLSL